MPCAGDGYGGKRGKSSGHDRARFGGAVRHLGRRGLWNRRGLSGAGGRSGADCPGFDVGRGRKLYRRPGEQARHRYPRLLRLFSGRRGLLGVRHETLQQYGAVSEQVACQMAQGVRLAMGADIGVSTTGVAGPTGSEQKPAGLVYIGLSTKEGTRAVRILKTNQSRDRVRRQASSTALDLVRRYAQGLKQ